VDAIGRHPGIGETIGGLYQSTPLFVVNSQGNVVASSTLTNLAPYSSVEVGPQSTSYSLLKELPEEGSTVKVAQSGIAAEVAPGLIAAEGQTATTTTETAARFSFGAAGQTIADVAANPLTGGAITVAANALHGDYNGLNAEQRTIAVSTDAVAGTVISGVSDAAGVAVGAVLSPFITPVGGVAAGVVVAGGLNYLGNAAYSGVRTNVINGVTSTVNELNSFGSWLGSEAYDLTHSQ
jgi:hypothetical protein